MFIENRGNQSLEPRRGGMFIAMGLPIRICRSYGAKETCLDGVL